jgi:hypothetical protein
MKPLVYVLTILTLTGSLDLGWSRFRSRLGDLSRHSRTLEGEQARQRDLEERAEAVFASIQAKQQVVRDIIAGRLSLRDGVARFRLIALSSPDYNRELFYRHFTGASEEDRYGRAVIAEAEAQLSDQPDQARVVVRRLEAELNGLLSHQAAQPPV